MKPTDFSPRVSAFLSHLNGKNLIGIEVGCDVGAHAEALLTWCDIEKLYLVDRFDNQSLYWYLLGRLETKATCRQKFRILHNDSHASSREFEGEVFDFIYIDITHDSQTVLESLDDWWPLLKKGGVLGYRNYSQRYPDIKEVVDQFVQSNKLRNTIESYQAEIIIFK